MKVWKNDVSKCKIIPLIIKIRRATKRLFEVVISIHEKLINQLQHRFSALTKKKKKKRIFVKYTFKILVVFSSARNTKIIVLFSRHFKKLSTRTLEYFDQIDYNRIRNNTEAIGRGDNFFSEKSVCKHHCRLWLRICVSPTDDFVVSNSRFIPYILLCKS